MGMVRRMNEPLHTNSLRTWSHAPRLYVDPGFCDEAELIGLRGAVLSAEDAEQQGLNPKDDATGLSYELPIDGAAALEALRARIEALTGIANTQGDTFRFRRYEPGRGHPPHTDGYVIDGATLIATAMLCLEAPALGGDTVFPEADDGPMRVIPRAGQLVLWFNYDEDGDEDLQAVHLSTPVLQGAKVTLTAFLYADLAAAATTIDAPPVDDTVLEVAKTPQTRDESTILRGLGRRLVCIDEDVPEITLRLLQVAAWERGLRFEPLIANTFDYRSAPR